MLDHMIIVSYFVSTASGMIFVGTATAGSELDQNGCWMLVFLTVTLSDPSYKYCIEQPINLGPAY